MKKIYIILFASLLIISCGSLPGYPTTTFYVKNNSEKVVNFKNSVIKRSTITGPFVITVPFAVQPKDSVLARQVGFKKDAEPQKWFSKFETFPIDGIKLFNPNKPENWKKGIDGKGRRIYTFTIAE